MAIEYGGSRVTGLVLYSKQKGFEDPNKRVNKCSQGWKQTEFPNEYFIAFQATVSPKLSSLLSLKQTDLQLNCAKTQL